MKNKVLATYNCLTLYKQDIIELSFLFHTYFQHVEILIDDIPIFNIAQLNPCDVRYEAETLIMRGLHLGMVGEGDARHYDYRPVELQVDRYSAKLSGWNANDKNLPEAAQQLQQFFTKRQHGTLNFWLGVASYSAWFGPSTSAAQFVQHHLPKSVNFLVEALLSVAPAIVLMPLALIAFVCIIAALKINRYVDLRPGAMRTPQGDGGYHVAGTLLVAVLVIFVLTLLAYLVPDIITLIARIS
jgi:hypothetical protein